MLPISQFRYNFTEENDWNQPIDSFICSNLCLGKDLLLEIGVYKAGFCFSILENVQDIKIYGVDPYPGLSKVRNQVISRINELGYRKRFNLYNEIKEIPKNIQFDLIHIDGNHSETAVMRDLIISSRLLKKDGFIVVDDIYHRDFPGIFYSLSIFISKNKFKSIFISNNKIYLTRSEYAKKGNMRIKKILNQSKISYVENFEMGKFGENYKQSNSIKNQNQLILRDNSVFENYLRAKKNESENRIGLIKANLKKIVKSITPPFLWKIYRALNSKFI